MERQLCLAISILALSLSALAQQSTAPPATPAEKQSNAASATQDTSGTTGDQISKPAGTKGSALIGCLAGPDKDGKFALRNMSHRAGVQVVGPDDLKKASGSKVKLTGVWQPLPQSQPTPQPQEEGKPAPERNRFQATDIEVMALKCNPPAETTPVSKNKQGKPTTYNAPSNANSAGTDTATNPN